MNNVLWVVVGGGVGSGARYLIALASVRLTGAGFPWGTLAVNVLGSFLLALLLGHFSGTSGSEGARLAVTTGLMGGFTTYSTFNQETLRLLQGGAYGAAAGYAGTTFAVCLLAGAAGAWLGRV